MFYRIDFQHFVTHMIDYFTMDEILHFQYFIYGGAIRNKNRKNNIAKDTYLYPSPDIVIDYEQERERGNADTTKMRKMYFEYLEESKNDENDYIGNFLYKSIINPYLKHNYDILIICDKTENVYLDVFCEYLKKKYHIEVADLNQLFTKGHLGSVYIDKNDIHNRCVELKRKAVRQQRKSMENSKKGREHLLSIASKKEKLKIAESIGLTLTEGDKRNLDKVLTDYWVNIDDEEDD